ncbi:hypothetical protein niasHS_009904 [Heterodera schachtii]|uniref:7TM GPCR serpentine receptor class x (Srx) domain-containing protein n=1 Tax=Heterodera schachtii TaxID=97005 RepID=A0ABD2JCV5_HETSC
MLAIYKVDLNTSLTEAYQHLTSADGPADHLFVLIASILGILALLGMTINFFLSLNGSANKLLAIYSFCELFHQSGYLLLPVSVFLGRILIPYKIFIRFLSFPCFTFCSSIGLIFFTSIDRLFHVLFPIITRQKMYTRFMFCVSLPLSAIYAAIFLCNFTCQNFDEQLIIGTISDLALAFYRCNGGAAGRLFFARNIRRPNAEKANLRIFRSLFVIIFVNIEDSHLSMELWTWNQILAILLNLSANRKAFQKELKVIGKTVTKCC